MIQFDPSQVPEFNAVFFRRQCASAPPGHRPHALYLGQRQMAEFAVFNSTTNPTTMKPFVVRGVKFYPVGEMSHFLMTFVAYEPTRDELIRELLDYCLTLPTHQNCPPEFLDLVVRAERVDRAPIPTAP